MVELVDALVSGASVERRAGSSPVSGTIGHKSVLTYNGRLLSDEKKEQER